MGGTSAEAASADLMVDLIISLDGYASARGGQAGGVWRVRNTWRGRTRSWSPGTQSRPWRS
ncbi:hypothetical protein AHiyo4_22030 [Arthrobacter sp. Hiyo4]|nr:hypothetical protein AHiyo4_22030 [Arthrobacter sp. Hiyo4]